MTLTNSTLSGNSAGSEAGGIYNLGTVNAANTLIVNNNNGAFDYGDVSPYGIGSTNVRNLTGRFAFANGETTPQDHGGPTRILAIPIPTTPTATDAYQQGDLATCNAITPDGTPAGVYDQRGAPRVVGGTCRIGAFEPGLVSTTTALAAAPMSGAFGTSVTLTAVVRGVRGDTPPDGTNAVTFTNGSTALGTASLTGGTATLSTRTLGPGNSVTATYTAGGAGNPYAASPASPASPAASVTITPISCVVTSTADPTENGKLTLRDAVNAANVGACTGNTITFDPTLFATPQTITLTGGTLALNHDVAIDGTGRQVVVDGNCTTDASSTCTGGGSTVFTVNSNVTAALTALTIQHGKGATGGIANNGTLTVTNSTFTDNSGGEGGGITNNGTLTVTNSTIAANSATNGGAILTRGALTVTNSTIANNYSSFRGGGIYTYVSVTLTLTNTILAGNTGGDVSNFGTVTGGGHNLIGSIDGAGFSGTGNTSGPALLTPLGSYGGSTQTFALLPGSAALGGGDSTTCANAPVGGKDQRGSTRPDASTTACDIGAFESQGFTVTKTSGDTQSVVFAPPTPFAPLTATITSKDTGVTVNGGTLTFVIVPGSGSATFDTAGSTGCTVSGDKLTASGCTVNASGVATSPPFTGTVAGGFTVTASVTPGDAPEATYSETVTKATPTTAVGSGTNPSTYGQSVTFTATVSGIAGITPTGTVQFSYTPSGGTSTNFGTPVTLDAMGNAIMNTSSLPAGSDTITATYSGDADYTPGAPGGVIQTVAKAGTTTSLAISPSPAAHGSPVTLTATVAPATTTGLPTPNGTVTFVDSGTPLATVTLDSGGQAALTTSALTVGVHHVTATYTPASPGPYATSQVTQDVTITAAALVSIAVTPANGTLKVGQVQQYTATGTYADGTTADLTGAVGWSSDAAAIANVDTSGKGTGQSPGVAHLTATQGTVSGQAAVTVDAPTLTGVAPAPQPASRPVGTTSEPSATPAPSGSGRSGAPGGAVPVSAPSGR